MTKTPEELTKEWKAGKLDVGFYYVKGKDGLFGIMSDYALYRVNLSHPDNEITLLAPVPTYDEYRAMEEKIKELEDRIADLQKWERHTWDYDLQAERISELLTDNKKMREQVVRLNKDIEQWQKAYQNTVTEQCSVKNECARLHALLRECKHHLYFQKKINNEIITLLVRIDAALGKSEE